MLADTPVSVSDSSKLKTFRCCLSARPLHPNSTDKAVLKLRTRSVARWSLPTTCLHDVFVIFSENVDRQGRRGMRGSFAFYCSPPDVEMLMILQEQGPANKEAKSNDMVDRPKATEVCQ